MTYAYYPEGDALDAIAARSTYEPHMSPEQVERARRTLLVGELNPYGNSPEFAFYPRPRQAAGYRLGQILGISGQEQEATWRANLCTGKWSAKTAAERMEQLIEGPWSTIVLCGAKVQRALQDGAYHHLAPQRAGAGFVRMEIAPPLTPFSPHLKLILMPHPSGQCRLWNIPGLRDEARRVYQEYA